MMPGSDMPWDLRRREPAFASTVAERNDAVTTERHKGGSDMVDPHIHILRAAEVRRRFA